MNISTKKKAHVRTIKVRLLFEKEDYSTMRKLERLSWRAANWIVMGQMINDGVMARLYARKKIDKKDKAALSVAEEAFRDFYGTKRQATTERDIKAEFPSLPSCITNQLNNLICANYRNDKKEMALGKRTARTYKEGMPIPFKKDAIRFDKNKGGNIGMTIKLNRRDGIVSKLFFGQDRAGFKKDIEAILRCEKEYCASMIKLDKKGWFYLLLPVKDDEKEHVLNPDLIVGVDLGIAIPAYVACSSGPQRKAIGSADELFRVRCRLNGLRRTIQGRCKRARGGKGRSRKMAKSDNFRDKERRYVQAMNHAYSKEIVSFTVKAKAATIKMEDLSGFGKDDESKQFLLGRWSYFELQQMVEYKAAREGIKVVYVDPRYTSQECSACNYIGKENRKEQAKFECSKCGEKFNADHNAALNIARREPKKKKSVSRLGLQPKGGGQKPLTKPAAQRRQSLSVKAVS